MPAIDYTNRVVVFRIAAYGPASTGKTTLLWRLHAETPPVERGEMTVRAIGADQLVSFDCDAPGLIPTGEYRAKLHIFTVPGRVQDPAIWRRVMTDVDGVIFVADSQFERIGENADALHAIAELRGIADVPAVFIYNKRDLPHVAPVEYIDSVINNAEPRIPRFEGVLSEGRGAAESLAALIPLLLQRAARQEEAEVESAERFVAAATGGKLDELPTIVPPPPEPEPISSPEIVGEKTVTPQVEGGCRCDGIRYRLLAPPREAPPHQGTPVVACAVPQFVIIRGRTKEYGADNRTRSFCPECGTMLTFRDLSTDEMLIASATLDLV